MAANTIRLAAEEDAVQVAEIYAPIVAGTATSFEVVSPLSPRRRDVFDSDTLSCVRRIATRH